MLDYIKRHKKILLDFLYSFFAYALPTIVLQFVVQPVIAFRTTGDENGLFIALFNVVKLMIGVFILPLANLRLIRKQECEKTPLLNAFFNHLFVVAIILTVVIGSALNGFYRGFVLTFSNISLFLVILFLMAIHDYFMIEFRLILNYKKIVVDNFMIVLGYGLGLLLFIKTGRWEVIFISGYLFGTTYVLFSTKIWRMFPSEKAKAKYLYKQYGEISSSELLKNASTYCDRLIIFPILGGFDVSVYNSAAVVSKAISVISSPLRNVLLSYIVNNNKLEIRRKALRKFLPIGIVLAILLFAVFWGFSIVACKFLYPQYAEAAMPYIPIIILAIMVETSGAIMNIALLRFANTKIQTIISAIKLGVYLLLVGILAVLLHTGLLGFCIAILLADISFTVAVMIALKNKITFTD